MLVGEGFLFRHLLSGESTPLDAPRTNAGTPCRIGAKIYRRASTYFFRLSPYK